MTAGRSGRPGRLARLAALGAFSCLLAALGYCIPDPEPPPSAVALSLRGWLQSEDEPIGATFEATIENRSERTITLVHPGDGSGHAWRSPAIYWRVNGRLQERGSRCGNMSALKRDEVFALPPGARRRLSEWLGAPHLPAPGRYTVSCVYRNDPGLPVDDADPSAAAAVRASSLAIVESNEVSVTIPARSPPLDW